MSTTAEKLTYLNTTKGKIKDSINLTGANISSNDTFRSYATKLRDGLVQVLNDNGETLYNNFPKVSGTGSSISLSNTLEAPMNINKLDGDTLQDGEPTPDTPVEIQSVEGIQNITISDGTDSDSYEVNLEGKNLLPFTNQDFTYKNVRYYVQNGNLYLDGTSTGETGVNITEFKENFSFTLPAGTYVFNRGQNGDAVSLPSYIRKYSDNSTLATNWGRFTLQEETKVFLGFYIYNKTFDNNFIDIQLEKGDTATSYVPYRSPIKLYNGDYITGTPDNWSIERNNNKYIVDTSRISLQDNYTNIEYARIPKPSDYKGYGNFTPYDIICSKAKFSKYPSSYDNIQNINNIYADAARNDYWLGFAKGTGLTIIQEKLANTEIIYPIKTPTTEQITDTYLISQLNALYNAKSYNGQTNISVSGNLPMILEVSALKDEI